MFSLLTRKRTAVSPALTLTNPTKNDRQIALKSALEYGLEAPHGTVSFPNPGHVFFFRTPTKKS